MFGFFRFYFVKTLQGHRKLHFACSYHKIGYLLLKMALFLLKEFEFWTHVCFTVHFLNIFMKKNQIFLGGINMYDFLQ